MVLKKLTMIYIYKGLTLRNTAQILNLFNSYSFFNVGLTICFFSFENTKYFQQDGLDYTEFFSHKPTRIILEKGSKLIISNAILI